MKNLIGALIFLLPMLAHAGLPPIAVPSGTTIRFLAPGLRQAGICTLDSTGKMTSVPGGSAGRTTHTASANFTIPTLTKDYILNLDTSGGVLSAVLPDSVSSDGLCADVKNIGSPVSNATITAFGGQTIDGAGSYVLSSANQSAHFCAVNGNWFNY